MRAGEQGLVDLLGEQPLAAGLRQRAVLDPVAGGVDDLDGDVVLRDAMRPGESARTIWACARASGLPRVPMRRGGGVKALRSLPVTRDYRAARAKGKAGRASPLPLAGKGGPAKRGRVRALAAWSNSAK